MPFSNGLCHEAIPPFETPSGGPRTCRDVGKRRDANRKDAAHFLLSMQLAPGSRLGPRNISCHSRQELLNQQTLMPTGHSYTSLHCA